MAPPGLRQDRHPVGLRGSMPAWGWWAAGFRHRGDAAWRRWWSGWRGKAAPCRKTLRPALGGAILIAFALYSPPDTLSSGHGRPGAPTWPWPRRWRVVLILLVLKAGSLESCHWGFGFRGGLFFASLFLGSPAGPRLCRGAEPPALYVDHAEPHGGLPGGA